MGNGLFEPRGGGKTFGGLSRAPDEQDVGTEWGRDRKVRERLLQRFYELVTGVPLAD
jgi:hypothetical protein